MSWKGLSKAVSRLPHQVLSKTGRADASTDPEYRTLQRRFDESVRVATLLHKEAETYKSALTGMLQHQCSFSDVLAEIYEPFSGEEANQAEAAQEYSRASKEIQEELLMHINMLDDMVVLPLSSLQDVLKRVSKAMAKRDRKKLDFDRYSHAMQKFKDEQNAKSIAKAQDNLRMATEEYDKYNDLLKNELPQLFELEAELTGSVLLQLYDLQCLIYGSLVERMQSIAETGHYATLDQDVVAGYQQRVAEAKARESIENLQMFEKNLDAKLSRNYKREHEKEEQQDHQEREQPYTQNDVQQAIPNSYEPSAPPLSEAPDVEYQEHPEVYAVALYDYEAQGTNDLGFRKDQTIQILEPSTDNTNTWWMARIDDKEGFVPANYVKLT